MPKYEVRETVRTVKFVDVEASSVHEAERKGRKALVAGEKGETSRYITVRDANGDTWDFNRT